eukprot:2524658-Amphidinium_carterae.2
MQKSVHSRYSRKHMTSNPAGHQLWAGIFSITLFPLKVPLNQNCLSRDVCRAERLFAAHGSFIQTPLASKANRKLERWAQRLQDLFTCG